MMKRKTWTGSHPSSVPVPAFRALMTSSTAVNIFVCLIAILLVPALPALASDVSIIQPAGEPGAAHFRRKFEINPNRQATYQTPVAAYFRRMFEINGPVRSGRVSVSQQGLNTYRLYVNGAFVGNGSRCHPCNETNTEGWDVTPLLAAGSNVIAVESLNSCLALYMDIELLNGDTMRISTDTEWTALPDAAHTLTPIMEDADFDFAGTLDARLMPRVVLGPVAGYADPQGIYMQFIEWFTPAYNDSEWPRAVVSGNVSLLPTTGFLEPSRPILSDFLSDIIDYGDVTPELQFIGRKTPEVCISPVQDFAAARLYPPQYADAPFRVITPGQSAAFIAFKNVEPEYLRHFFIRLFSTTGGEIIDAMSGVEFFCVTNLNEYSIYGFGERYITRKGIQDWRLRTGGGNLLLIIRNAHEPLFIHSVGIQ